jgi:MerR family gold-responsive transcriptional activator of gol and ges genes
MADTLQQLIKCCAGDDRPDCPILATLEDPADEQAQEKAQADIPARDRLRGKAPARK